MAVEILQITMSNTKENKDKKTSKMLETAAEQWVNLVLAQIIYKKPSYGFIKPKKN